MGQNQLFPKSKRKLALKNVFRVWIKNKLSFLLLLYCAIIASYFVKCYALKLPKNLYCYNLVVPLLLF